MRNHCRFFAVLGLFFAMSPLAAETTDSPPRVFYPCTTFYACRAELWEKSGPLMYGFIGNPDPEHPLPEDVARDWPIIGGTFTDGDELYGIVVLFLDSPRIDEEKFKRQLLANTFFESFFPDRQVAIHHGNPFHIPEGPRGVAIVISEKAVDFLSLKNMTNEEPADYLIQMIGELFAQRKDYIESRSYVGMLREFPEPQLYPVLPPENMTSEKLSAYLIQMIGEPFAQRKDYIESRCYAGILHEFPEHQLYPVLPPETENEGTFLRKVREYRAGHNDIDKINATFWGLKWTETDIELVWDRFVEEGTPAAETYRNRNTGKPFQLGGFFDEDTSGGAFRLYPKDISEDKFFLQCGTTIIPTEEREEDDRIYTMRIGFLFSKTPSQEYNPIVEEGIFVLNTVYQPENLPEEKGVPDAETMDEINHDFVESFHPLIQNIVSQSAEMEQDAPLDFAVKQQGDIFLAACALPPGGKPIDWKLAENIIPAVRKMFEHTPNPYKNKDPKEQSEVLESWIISLFSLSENGENRDGMDFSEFFINIGEQSAHVVFGYKPDLLCAAATIGEFDETAKQFRDESHTFEEMVGLLQECIEASQRLETEKMPVPQIVYQHKIDGRDNRDILLTNETAEGHTKYTLTVTGEAIGPAIQIAKMFLPSPR
ncbi:MAG: hypothetical protein LBQ54_11980 [Planctomycetaceae bacterium]|jgi:hypothetical protein|nr:hypothetical protein [Planctomycetaceae bacterium]